MRYFKLTNVILAGLFLLTFGSVASAKDTPDTVSHGELRAVYEVPDLDGALAKDLVKSLSKIEGLVSAKPDLEKGTIAVTFEEKLLTEEKLQQTLRDVAPETTLAKVGPAPAHKHTGCGKCPKKNSCADAKKDH